MKISAEPPLHGEVSKTCKKNHRHDGRRPHLGHDGQHNHKPGTKAVNDINGAMADNPAALPSPPARAGMTAWTNGVDDVDERSSPPPRLPPPLPFSSSFFFLFLLLLPPPFSSFFFFLLPSSFFFLLLLPPSSSCYLLPPSSRAAAGSPGPLPWAGAGQAGRGRARRCGAPSIRGGPELARNLLNFLP